MNNTQLVFEGSAGAALKQRSCGLPALDFFYFFSLGVFLYPVFPIGTEVCCICLQTRV